MKLKQYDYIITALILISTFWLSAWITTIPFVIGFAGVLVYYAKKRETN